MLTFLFKGYFTVKLLRNGALAIITAVDKPFSALFLPTIEVFDASNVRLGFLATKISNVNNMAVNIHFLWDKPKYALLFGTVVTNCF